MSPQPGPVRFEHRDDGLGLGTARPRLSWSLAPELGDQRGYEIGIERGGQQWRSGRLDGADRLLAA